MPGVVELGHMGIGSSSYLMSIVDMLRSQLMNAMLVLIGGEAPNNIRNILSVLQAASMPDNDTNNRPPITVSYALIYMQFAC